MSGGADEVEARVDAHVDLLTTLGLLLLAHERLVLVILRECEPSGVSTPLPGDRAGKGFAHDEVDDGRPRVAVVDVVAEAGRVDDGELDLELLLLQLGLDDVCARENGRRVSVECADGGRTTDRKSVV